MQYIEGQTSSYVIVVDDKTSVGQLYSSKSYKALVAEGKLPRCEVLVRERSYITRLRILFNVKISLDKNGKCRSVDLSNIPSGFRVELNRVSAWFSPSSIKAKECNESLTLVVRGSGVRFQLGFLDMCHRVVQFDLTELNQGQKEVYKKILASLNCTDIDLSDCWNRIWVSEKDISLKLDAFTDYYFRDYSYINTGEILHLLSTCSSSVLLSLEGELCSLTEGHIEIPNPYFDVTYNFNLFESALFHADTLLSFKGYPELMDYFSKELKVSYDSIFFMLRKGKSIGEPCFESLHPLVLLNRYFEEGGRSWVLYVRYINYLEKFRERMVEALNVLRK